MSGPTDVRPRDRTLYEPMQTAQPSHFFKHILIDRSAGWVGSYTAKHKLRILVHLPAHGVNVFPAPRHPGSPSRASEGRYAIKGEVEVRLAPDSPNVRCRGIRLVFRTWCRVDISSERRAEEDVIFEETFPLIGEHVFKPGSERYVSIVQGSPPVDTTRIVSRSIGDSINHSHQVTPRSLA